MVICLEQGSDLHMAQLMPLPLTVSCCSKIQTGFTFWYYLTQVDPEKELLNGHMCVRRRQQMEVIDFQLCAPVGYRVQYGF